MTSSSDLRNPTLLLAFGFGAGLAPKAPGTWGTLLAIPLWWALSDKGLPVYLPLAAFGFAAGVWLCERASRMLGARDHPAIVIDEVVGYFVALTVVPVEIPWLVLSFVLFRALDILKPWPISWLDRSVKGGLGIMLDDLVAGLLTATAIAAARCLAG